MRSAKFHPRCESVFILAQTMVSATKVDLPGTLAGTPVFFAESQRHPLPKHRNSLAHLFMMGFSGFHIKEHVSISSGSFDMAVRGKCL